MLACRYVDEVIIGAPWEVSNDMVSSLLISMLIEMSVIPILQRLVLCLDKKKLSSKFNSLLCFLLGFTNIPLFQKNLTLLRLEN